MVLEQGVRLLDTRWTLPASHVTPSTPKKGRGKVVVAKSAWPDRRGTGQKAEGAEINLSGRVRQVAVQRKCRENVGRRQITGKYIE